MNFLRHYRGRHFDSFSLLDLLPQINSLSSNAISKCLVSFDGGLSWKNSINGIYINLDTIDINGVQFETIKDSLVGTNPIIVFKLLLPKPLLYQFSFIQPLDVNKFIINTTKELK